MENRRDITIDYLKFIGVIGLMVAHTSSNTVLLFVRSFDVNLLVILSAILAKNSVSKINSRRDIIEYWKKRFLRLLIPTWIFITLYLIINHFCAFVDLAPINMVRAYLLQDNSIGYVWIIYVYIIVALEMPFLAKINLTKKSHLTLFSVIFMLYIILYMLSPNYYYRVIVLYPIIYGLISGLAINWDNFNGLIKKTIIICCGTICVSYAFIKILICGKMPLVGEYKYPPKVYYLSYTLAISFLLIELLRHIDLKKMPLLITRYITFISKSSLWFYLWHIFTLQIAKRTSESELIRFILVLSLTSLIVLIQRLYIKILEKKTSTPRVVLSLFKG